MLPLLSLAPLWSAQGRGRGGGKDREGLRPRNKETLAKRGKGRRRADSGQRGEGRGHCNRSPSSLQALVSGDQSCLADPLNPGSGQGRRGKGDQMQGLTESALPNSSQGSGAPGTSALRLDGKRPVTLCLTL